MKCQKCSREKENGYTYSFFYGKQMIENVSQVDGGLIFHAPNFRTWYKIFGQHNSWICNDCLRNKIAFYSSLLALGCFFISLSILVSPIFLILSFFGLMMIAYIAKLMLSGREDIGDRMALALNESHMRETYGYYGFLTRKQYKKLKSQNAIQEET